MPTTAIKPTTLPKLPTITPTQDIRPDRIAARFVTWLIDHGLAREWTVDDVWYLAAEDFGPANEAELPPRRVFLGALQRQAGVTVQYDRRVGRPAPGRLRRKTTFYGFSNCASSQMAIAA